MLVLSIGLLQRLAERLQRPRIGQKASQRARFGEPSPAPPRRAFPYPWSTVNLIPWLCQGNPLAVAACSHGPLHRVSLTVAGRKHCKLLGGMNRREVWFLD